MKRSLFVLGMLVLTCAGIVEAADARRAPASAPATSATRSGRPAQRYREEGTFHAFALQFSGLGVWQSGGSSYSGMFAWAPQYNFTSELGLRANLGASILKSNASDYFTVLDYELLLNYTFITEWEVEVGGGAMTWVNRGGTRPAVSATYAYKPKEKLFDFVDSIFATYTRVFITDNAANLVRLGVAVGL